MTVLESILLALQLLSLGLVAVLFWRLARKRPGSNVAPVDTLQASVDNLPDRVGGYVSGSAVALGGKIEELLKREVDRIISAIADARRQYFESLQALEKNDEARAAGLGSLIVHERKELAIDLLGKLDFDQLLSALKKRTGDLSTDIGQVHDSLAALDLPGVKQAVAQLQIALGQKVADLHADLAAARTQPEAATSAALLEQMRKLEAMVDHKTATPALVEAALAQATAEQAAHEASHHRDAHYTAHTRRRRVLAVVARILHAQGYALTPPELEAVAYDGKPGQAEA